jgi:hypothetical protein
MWRTIAKHVPVAEALIRVHHERAQTQRALHYKAFLLFALPK